MASNGISSYSTSDTFVVLPPHSVNKGVIFGKNAIRPETEVQEVIYVPAADHEPGASLMCTHIEIPQVAHTHGVILSKPAWAWGAEMGANDQGVCIGKQDIRSTVHQVENNGKKKLVATDLVRLG